MKGNRLKYTLSFLIFCFIIYLIFSNFLIVKAKFNGFYFAYYILAVLKELFFLIPVIIWLAILKIKKNDIIDLIILFSLTLIGVVYGIKNGSSFINTVIAAKDFMLPFLFLILLRYKPFLFLLKNINLTYIYFGLLFAFLINFIYTTCMYMNFNGNLNVLWFYEYYQNPDWNYIRDGALRSTGFFDTSIQNSIFFGFCTLIFYLLMKYSRKLVTVFLFFIVTILSVLGIYMTHTRIGWIIFLLGVVMSFFIKKTKLYFSFLFTGLSISFVFLYILFFYDEPSAKGRILQYLILYEKIKDNPSLLFLGFGFGKVGPKYNYIAADSAILEIIYTFGLIGALFYFYIFIKIFKNKILSNFSSYYTCKNNIYPLLVFSYLFFFLLIFISFFHSIHGKVVIYIFILLISIAVAKTNCLCKRRTIL